MARERTFQHDDSDAADGEPPRSLSDMLVVLSRRRRLAAWVAGGVALIALAVAFGLPAVYRSTATILIQEQEIPPEMVRSTVTSFADERIQIISQQVMTRATLLAMVERHSLYERVRQRETNEDLIDRMRRDIRVTPISAEVTDRRTGAPSKATIAFSLSYDSEVAGNAQKIANELVTLYLNENLKNRQQKAAETTSFLEDERTRIGARLSEAEQKLAAFKRRYPDRLPEMGLSNRISSERQVLEMQRLDREIVFLDERRVALQAQLADTKPATPVLGVGGAVLQPEDRLRTLQVQLISLMGLYSDDHPDVRRLKREIAAFKQETRLQNNADDREARLTELRQALANLRQRYSDEHPDVVKLKRAYSAIEAAVRVGGEPGVTQPAVSSPRKPDNPVYLNLQQQVQTTVSQIAALRAERDMQKLRLEQLDSRLAQSPEVEREYLELTRDLDSARVRLRELGDKQLQAEGAEQLERSRKAERFTLIEPPIFPERPYKPNRAAIAAVGLLLALLAGAAAVALREALDPNVHGARALAAILQVPVLAVIPQQAGLPVLSRMSPLSQTLPSSPAAAEPFARRVWFSRAPPRAWLWGTSLLAALAVVLAFHQLFMPLDVAWFSLLRRLGG